MDNAAHGEEFVTIVPVGEGRPAVHDSAFVTVLTVGAAAGAAEVLVRRPRGARLGLGLKFEGGSAAAEKVRRLLVQSCAQDSPAANATTPWGKLIPGDEILAIDDISVSDLTRIDCVRRLKDSDETLKLLVRHFEANEDNKSTDVSDVVQLKNKIADVTRPTCLPPPVPPRKLGKKNSFKERPTFQTGIDQNGDMAKQVLGDKDIVINGNANALSAIKLSRKSSFDSHIYRQNKEGLAMKSKKGSPEEVRRLVRRLSDGKAMPPDAEVYIDLLSTEWERCLALADAESDDTGSSISTVVDRLGSMGSSVENSIPSTPVLQPKTIDIQKVLNCIENIDTDILCNMTKTKLLEKPLEIKTDSRFLDYSADFFSHEQSNATTKENLSTNNETAQNDKNNNNTIIRNITCINIDAKETRNNTTESNMVKPKPMPRITKTERVPIDKKPKEHTGADVPKTQSEVLLTPTKKTCIETWLQRSEAEMNSEMVEEQTAPEALPRLIDFVPKPQFKDCSDKSLPSTPQPAPPTETREDGSGASLDTIGELDETGDVVDNGKPMIPATDGINHKSFNSSFWDERVNRSDAEDKSLSNDETPPPTCPRQPPDGVEAPTDVVEKVLEIPSVRLPPKLPAGWPTNRTRFSYSRTQDPRSEASVKDKIAMFSVDRVSSSDLLDKCGTLPTRSVTVNACRKTSAAYVTEMRCPEIRTLDRRLTKSQDNLDDMFLSESRSYKRLSERPEVLGAIESKKINSSSNIAAINNNKKMPDNKLVFYGSTATLSSTIDSSNPQHIYHRRSNSDDIEKNSHKSNLEYLIEQRKKSMSKLRGLMIPDTQAPIVDLPEIKVQGNLPTTLLFNNNKNKIDNKSPRQLSTKTLNLNEPWKMNLLSHNIPKYSPAFKRKSLQVYSPSLSKESTPERKLNQTKDISLLNHSILLKPRMSVDLINVSEKLTTSTLPSKFTTSKLSEKNFNSRNFNNVEIKICTVTEVVDSDNDSAMSSTQSSYRSSASSPLHNLDSIESDSSHLSPRATHYASYTIVKSEIPSKSSGSMKNCEEYEKRKVCRSMSSDTNVSLSSSAGSAATSGSQASCSSLESSVPDLEKRQISKTYNIDTINRRNILASAKCRSGRDAKLSSPVVESKFAHEPCDKPSSPPNKPSDRLSTLTQSVSAISNKGETRRRSKIVTETDSDSDNELAVRQRKADFKNSRLKRNSSSNKNDKTKQKDLINSAISKEEAPEIISDRIIKEIKKAGLDNYSENLVKIEKVNLEKYQKDIRNTVNGSVQCQPNGKDKEVLVSKMTEITNKTNKKASSELSDEDRIDGVAKTLQIVRLKKGMGSGVGLILAGGIDCEAKEVTIHRVLADSIADRAGLKRGVRVYSINGSTMEGLTHAQSVAVLKEQRSEIVIEIEDESQNIATKVGCGSENAESKVRNEVKKPANIAGKGVCDMKNGDIEAALVTVVLEKAGGGAGLGFGLDGGRDSPRGDAPLTIKKLFAGGAAARSGRVVVGAELLSAGGKQFDGFTRTQAWATLKALPAGPVALVLRNPASATGLCL